MLIKQISGAEKNSEKRVVSPSSATRVRWDHFEAQMNRLILMEAIAMASSRFNRVDFIRGVQRFLESTPFFKTVNLREGEMSLEDQKSFKLKIDLIDFKITDEFLKQMQENEFKHESQDQIYNRVKEKLVDLIIKVCEEFKEVQSVRVDPVSKLFNSQHFDDWVWYQNRELQSHPGDHLNFFMINMDSFASVNDYFSHATGDEVLKNMGVALTDLRHHIHSQFNIPYEQIGIHRHIGPNFVLSIRTKNGQKMGAEEIFGLLKNKIENHKHPIDWNWKVNESAVLEMHESSVVTLVHEMKKNNGQQVDIKNIPRFKKSDAEQKQPITGVKINMGYFAYPGQSGSPAESLTAKELSQVVNHALVYLNNLKKNQTKDELMIYFSDEEYKEEIKKFIDDQRTNENEEMKWALQFIRDWNDHAERINEKRSLKDVNQVAELTFAVLERNQKSPSRQEIENALLNDFKKQTGENETKIVPFYEMIKRTALQKMLKQRYRPVYKMGSKYFFPVMDRQGHIHYMYEVTPHRHLTTSQVISMSKRVLVHDVVYTQFMKKSKNDFLTGLPNRQAFEQDFDHVFGRDELGLGAFDLNGFSGFTQTFGMAAGDAIIREMSVRLNQIAHAQGVRLYRYGGEEFELMGPDAESLERALKKMDEAMEDWLKEDNGWDYSISWNQILDHLSAIRGSMSSSQMEQLEKAYQAEIKAHLKGQPFDPQKPYPVHLLRMLRYVPKKGQSFMGLSFSAGIISIKRDSEGHRQKFVDEADHQAHYAKTIFDNLRLSNSMIIREGKKVEK